MQDTTVVPHHIEISVKVQKCDFLEGNNHSFPFTHIHGHTQLLILVHKLKYMQGLYFRSREFSRPRITPHKELISWPTSLCFVKGAYFTFPQLYYLPFYSPVGIPTIDDNLSRHLLWMPPRHFSLCLYFNLRLELLLNPSSA